MFRKLSPFSFSFFSRLFCMGIYCLAGSMSMVGGIAISHAQQFHFEQHPDKVDLLDGGKLLTSYHFRSGSKPILWPLVGPDQQLFSRSYPMDPDSRGEEHDHPHHRSLWMTFGHVNDTDLWAEGKGKGTVCHVGDVETEVHERVAILKCRHLWKSGSPELSSVSSEVKSGCDQEAETLLECRAEYHFSGLEEERTIDCYYELKAVRELLFGDTKEGMFAIRVPEPMRADKHGGSILTSDARKNENAWGYPAKWIDYSGRTQYDNPKRYGIGILVHPNSYNAQGRWHVRTYGLFAHNPFGVHDFPPLESNSKVEKVGGHSLKAGESIHLAYRVILHRGSWDNAVGEKHYENFSKVRIPN